ncbi:hypothetical protein Q8A67_021812 [Cirrhinus molitorella]|uniref:Uncharacterized protein n=1 Tax=Cirrhinus molitorella TaxID=172907 RepID=A0AA88TCA7_9TELE|nr:hypothetical protein Q8A67_021812 [Cirrhinus molitorella]
MFGDRIPEDMAHFYLAKMVMAIDSDAPTEYSVPRPKEARLAVSSAREEEDVVFQLYDSEELDMLSIDVGELPENSPLHSHVQEELVDVLACAVAKLNINCHKKVRKCRSQANWMSF